MSTNDRISKENGFIEQHRDEIAAFAEVQYRQEDKGVVAVTADNTGGFSTELRYLSTSLLQANKLLGGDQQSAIEAGVINALEQYDPDEQIILLFLYERQASVYMLSRGDLIGK